ncbi:hypothetical protein N7461_008395 [Penicillium sp. DV-2018c]|nr:hypothetical protein N7461_008395 [Penicillium sp. DV-2018c]
MVITIIVEEHVLGNLIILHHIKVSPGVVILQHRTQFNLNTVLCKRLIDVSRQGELIIIEDLSHAAVRKWRPLPNWPRMESWTTVASVVSVMGPAELASAALFSVWSWEIKVKPRSSHGWLANGVANAYRVDRLILGNNVLLGRRASGTGLPCLW